MSMLAEAKGERVEAGRWWFAACFLPMVPRFNFKVLIHVKFCCWSSFKQTVFRKKNGSI